MVRLRMGLRDKVVCWLFFLLFLDGDLRVGVFIEYLRFYSVFEVFLCYGFGFFYRLFCVCGFFIGDGV